MFKHVRKTVVFAMVFGGLLGLAALTPALAHAAAKGRFFTGFWEGIDPVDGSTVQMSLANLDNSGSLDFIYREGFFTYCYSQNDTQGRGYAMGTATVVGKNKISINATCICVLDNNSQNSQPCSFDVTANPRAGVLIVPNFSNPDIIMHRTSCK